MLVSVPIMVILKIVFENIPKLKFISVFMGGTPKGEQGKQTI